ncbi:hypothetical protein [Streptomyces sp. NPDC090029]|uniref:hypothetical protein n=1 Tax=unclassified Streptomyces TaxID=2593676 RepID=UPI00380EC460
MSFTRFLCAAALAVGVSGAAGGAVAQAVTAEPPASRATAVGDCTTPGDTEWRRPVSQCPPTV